MDIHRNLMISVDCLNNCGSGCGGAIPTVPDTREHSDVTSIRATAEFLMSFMSFRVGPILACRMLLTSSHSPIGGCVSWGFPLGQSRLYFGGGTGLSNHQLKKEKKTTTAPPAPSPSPPLGASNMIYMLNHLFLYKTLRAYVICFINQIMCFIKHITMKLYFL